jgi:hypothetical protein
MKMNLLRVCLMAICLVLPVHAGAWQACFASASAPPSTTYFGETAQTSFDTGAAGAIAFRNLNKTYTCPGTGNKSLVELSAYVRSGGGTPGHVRLAIYDTSNNLIYQGNVEVTVSNTTADWIGHTGITGVILQGGTNYKIAASFDSSDVQPSYYIGTLGDHSSYSADYTGGWPSSLADGGNEDWIKSVRAGVQ